MSHSGSDGDLFLSAIDQSIGEWTELQHVIEVYGAGGRAASEKLTWMSNVLFDYFKCTPMDQLKYEIHDYIETIVDNEFDFIPMDKSMDSLIGKLMEYHSLWLTGQQNKMKTIMEERRKLNEIKRENAAKDSKTLDESLKKMVLSTSNDQQSTNGELNNSQMIGNQPPTAITDNMEGTSSSSSHTNDSNSQSKNDIDTTGDSSEWMVVNNKRKNRKR